MALILLIDDDQQLRTAVKRMLAAAGNHTVIEAKDGREGLAIFRSQRPSLVITDILMPEKEGIETIMDIRRSAPEVKIVAMSGGGSSGDTRFLQIAQKLGADAVLAKPVRAAELAETVTRLLPAKAG